VDVPSSKRLSAYFACGVLIALLEPLILLAMGDDIAGALWPMANRSLEWTLFLREWRTEIFALVVIAVPFASTSQSSVKSYNITPVCIFKPEPIS